MPYSYHWRDPQHTIMQVDITDKVTWAQWREVHNKLTDEIKKQTHRVDLIYNDSVGMPKGNPVTHLKATFKLLHGCPNLHLIVTVSSREISTFVEMIVNVMQSVGQQTDHHNGGFVTSMDKALAIIQNSRSEQQSQK